MRISSSRRYLIKAVVHQPELDGHDEMEDLACAKHPTPQSLPDELVYHILLYTSPCEVIRLRLVSKQFNDVARDTQLWKALYATARLPRPPGPFSWQSTRSLERILVPSERLSSTWASRPLKVVSITQGPRYRPIDTPNILFGRLFIWSGGKQVFAEDLEAGSHQMIWETDERIDSFKIFSMGFPDALRVYLAVSYIDELEPEERRIKLVVFSLQDETCSFGPVIHEMDLPEDARFAEFPGPTLSPLYFESDPDSGTQHMLVDPWTYTLYRFPPFNSNLIPPGHRYYAIVNGPLTMGPYIVSGFYTWVCKAVQIFTVPNQPHPVDGDLRLRLTHEALVNVPFLTHTLRDPVINPLTGDTTLRFLAGGSQKYCVDFTLPATASDSTEILSLAVTQKRLFDLPGSQYNLQLEASSDGYARGLYIFKSTSLSQLVANIYKFSIDASGEECTAMVSDVFQTLDVGSVFSQAFDGVRGRICYSTSRVDPTDLVVFDFQ